MTQLRKLSVKNTLRPVYLRKRGIKTTKFASKKPQIPGAETNSRENVCPKNFTGKELDAETGLYYYGARYLDPKTSRWLSGDPAMGEYLPVAPVNDEAKKHNENLPGMGGVFNYVNLHVYHYAGNNPVVMKDPDGKADGWQIAGGVVQIVGGVVEITVGIFGEPLSAGTSTFILIWGAKDVIDGAGKIITGVYDLQYSGLLPTAGGSLYVGITKNEAGRPTAEKITAIIESVVGTRIPAEKIGSTAFKISTGLSAGGILLTGMDFALGLLPENGSSSSYRTMTHHEIIQDVLGNIKKLSSIGTPTAEKSISNLKSTLSDTLDVWLRDPSTPDVNVRYYQRLKNELNDL